MKQIYIILMNTGTIPSKLIKRYTRYKYSHVVLSLDNKFTNLYSFGRKRINNFIDGGFVTYGIDSPFFQKFNKTECIIYELKISNNKYKKIVKIINKYQQDINLYHYDIYGLIVRTFKKNYKQRKYYHVCSEFVARILEDSNIYHFDKNYEYIRPKDFTKIEILNPIYEGKLLNIKNYFRKEETYE